VELQIKCLVLREFIEGDWPAVLAYQSTTHFLRYYPWVERDEGDVCMFIREFIAWQSDQPRCRHQFAVVLADGGRLIGSCGIRKEKPHYSMYVR
jgi:RimJ/RimL family protein N-acetyltransferase